MTNNPSLPSRKADHIRINLEEDVRSSISTGLDAYNFYHQALPEIDFNKIDTHQILFEKKLSAPLLISSMTGGTDEAYKINLILAEAAQAKGIAMGLGSQRAAIENVELMPTFQVRKTAPDILLFGNLGAVQLNYSYGLEQCQRAVEMIEADALILHLNPLQEALQPEGDTRFSGLLTKIEEVCRRLTVPVIVKEVGWGISFETAARLASAGVAAIDVAGAGGTSWSQVELYRIKDPHQARVAEAFRGWGIPTAESILEVHRAAPSLIIFASGGLKNGIDISKSIALGASVGGMAGRFLKAASYSVEEVIKTIEEISLEIRICMFATGSATLDELKKARLAKGIE